MLSVVWKILAGFIPQPVKEQLECLIDKEEVAFHSGSYYTNHTNLLWNSAQFRLPLHLLFVDFEKTLVTIKSMYIWRSVLDKIIAMWF